MNKKIKTKIPEFKSLDEEREYWEARGPLAEEQGGRINRPKPGQKRSSFLSIRLTGEELTQLRDVAAEFGMGPSTYTRQVLKLAIEQKNWPSFLPPSFLLKPIYDVTSKRVIKPLDELLRQAKKAYDIYLEAQKEELEEVLRIHQENELRVGEKT